MKIVYRDGMQEGKEEIEIESLEEHESEGDGYLKVSNREDFAKLVDAMGWDSIEDFEKTTGDDAEELIGKYFTVVHDRVYLEGFMDE